MPQPQDQNEHSARSRRIVKRESPRFVKSSEDNSFDRHSYPFRTKPQVTLRDEATGYQKRRGRTLNMNLPPLDGFDPTTERVIEYTIIVNEEDNAKMVAYTNLERMLSQRRRNYDTVDMGETHKLPVTLAFARFVPLVTCRRSMKNCIHCLLFDKIPDYDDRWAIRMVRKDVSFSELEDGYFQGLVRKEGVQIHRQEESHPPGTFQSTCQFMVATSGEKFIFAKTNVLTTAQMWLSM